MRIVRVDRIENLTGKLAYLYYFRILVEPIRVSGGSMDVKQAILERRSVRAFLGRDVEDDAVGNLLSLSNMAPSAGNLQARDFIVVRSRETKQRLAKLAHDQDFIAEAPVVIVACTNERRIEEYGSRGKALYTVQDVSAAIMALMLAAHDEGLATCWVGAFDPVKVGKLLQLPSYAKPVALVPLGYAAETPESPSRLSLREFVHRETW